MRLIAFNGNRYGTLDGQEITEIPQSMFSGYGNETGDPLALLFSDSAISSVESRIRNAGGKKWKLDEVELRPPVIRPTKIIGVAVNYQAHIDEMRSRVPSSMLDFSVFLKAPSSIVGPSDTVEIPEIEGREIHHEGELAFVVRKKCRNVSEEDWRDCILGYMCSIDMSIRGTEDRSLRKSFDTFFPIGPHIVTSDEIEDPHNLSLDFWVNGKLRQSANTGQMITKIPRMISFITGAMTLYPGDIVSTGTPEGVGPVKDGDMMKVQVERVGSMEIPVKASGAKIRFGR